VSGRVGVELAQHAAAAGVLAGGEADGARDGVVGVPGGAEVDGQCGDEDAGEQEQAGQAGAGDQQGGERGHEVVHVPPPGSGSVPVKAYDIGRRCPDYMSRFTNG